MKKFLSLMLALIMVMSLVTVGAGATFTDADDVQYTEAVDLMYGLGILGGYADGSFDPQGNLSRGAAAKIIAYIALGKEEAEALSGDEMAFTDVSATSSMRPFIAWAAEQGIVNGTTTTTFEPKAPVGGHAFLKMVLGALKIDGVYTGTQWRKNVEIAADAANLFTGIDTDEVDFKELMTRELACQIAFNAMVNYVADDGDQTPDETITTYKIGGMSFSSATEAAMYKAMVGLTEDIVVVTVQEGTLLDNVHKVAKATGVVTVNSSNADTTKTTVKVPVAGGQPVNMVFATKTGLDLLGSTVDVYYKQANTQPTAGYTVMSIVDAATIVTITADDDAEDVEDKLDAAGIDVDTDITNAAITTVDTVGALNDGTISIAFGTDTGATIAGNGNASIDLYIIDDTIVATKLPLAKSLLKVTDIDADAGEERIKLGNTWYNNGIITNATTGATNDVVNEYEGIAKNDYVVVTVVGAIYNLEKVTTVTGVPSKIVTVQNGDPKITIDGVEYAQLGTNSSDKQTGTVNLKNEIVLFLDGQGNYIVAADVPGATAATDVVYLTTKYQITVDAEETAKNEFGETEAGDPQHITYFAQTVNMAGEEVIYQIKKAQFDDDQTFAAGGIYKLSKATGVTEDTDNQVLVDDKNDQDPTNDEYFVVKAEYATLADMGAQSNQTTKTGSVTLSANLKDTAIKLDDSNYFADEVTFLWIDGTKTALEVTVKEGVQALTASAQNQLTVLTVYTVDSASQKNTVKAVIIEDKFVADTVYTGDVVYVDGTGTVTSDTAVKLFVDPTDETETEQTAYEYEVYVNGVKTEVALANTQLTAGAFYKMTEVVEGVYKLETGLTNTATGLTMSQYKGLATFEDNQQQTVALEDLDITTVEVIDLVNVNEGDTKITDATKITGETVAVVFEKALNATTNSVVTIYITGAAPQNP